MALRCLAVKMTKALPLRVSAGSRAFATAPKPKEVLEDLSRKIAAARDPTKYSSAIEMFDTVMPLIRQKQELSWQQELKRFKLGRKVAVLIGFGGGGAVAHLASKVA